LVKRSPDVGFAELMVGMATSSATLSEAVGTLMRQAGERAILPHYRQLAGGDVIDKAAGEPVTIADRQSEEILAAGLARLIPEATIVGEEAADADPALLGRLGDALCWIIDPLDGTANFVAGEGPFGILVALAEHGETIGGWIYDPRSGRFAAAIRGEGARIDGERVQSRASVGRPRTAAISSLFASDDRRAKLCAALEPRFQTVPIPRCAAEQYPRMILGVNDLTLFERTLPWDHAAGVLCLVEAGGRATRFDGSPYRLTDGRTGLLAAPTPALWDEAISCIALN
jgi:fructose-1,6-bisphosphatase/inositol monophosphatase family enzyme